MVDLDLGRIRQLETFLVLADGETFRVQGDENVAKWIWELGISGAELLTAARRGLEIESALKFLASTDTALIGRPFQPENILALATELGWSPPNGAK